MDQICVQTAQIFPAKRLSLFFTYYQTPFKSADFFPAKRLSLFLIISGVLLKAHIFSRQKTKKQIYQKPNYFPAKRLRIIFIFFDSSPNSSQTTW